MNNRTVEVVRLTNLSKSFTLRTDKSIKESVLNFFSKRKHTHKFQALNGISLSINSGTTLGLIGHNGSGKSTLLKIIGGILEPTSGVVERRGNLAALLELGAGFHPDLTGRENVYLNASILGLSKAEVDRRFASIVDFSGINDFIDTQVKFYSSGMYVRLAFAVAVNVDPDILLVDEVLAVGDELFQQKCIGKIKEFQAEGRTIIIVSHSADQVKDLCDTVVLLEQGIPIYQGEPEEGIKLLRRSLLERDGQKNQIQINNELIRDFKVQILSGGVVTNKSLVEGSGFIIEAHFDLSQEFQKTVQFEMVLTSERGQSFSCVSKDDTEVHLPNVAGKQSVAFTVPKGNTLPAGTYSVTANLNSQPEGAMASVQLPDCFRIESKASRTLDKPFVQGSFSVASVK